MLDHLDLMILNYGKNMLLVLLTLRGYLLLQNHSDITFSSGFALATAPIGDLVTYRFLWHPDSLCMHHRPVAWQPGLSPVGPIARELGKPNNTSPGVTQLGPS